MGKDRLSEVDELRQPVFDSFRAVLDRLFESYNEPDARTARNARREARKLGAGIVRTFKDYPDWDKRWLKDVVTRMTQLIPGDDWRDLYYLLLSTKVAPATVVRDLLGIRPHGALPRSKGSARC